MNNIINQMTKNIIKTIGLAMALVLIVPGMVYADPSVGDAGNAATVATTPSAGNGANAATVADASTPSTGNGVNAATVSTPSAGNGANAATVADASTPSTGNGGNAATVSTVGTPSAGNGANAATIGSVPSVGNGGNAATIGTPTTPVPPVVTPPSGGGTISGGSGGGSGFFSGSGSAPINPIITISPVANCSYITTYLKFGGNNNSTDVTKLQTFLKNTEKLDVDINGQFDQKTLDAVKAFQAKYVNDTMAPWGVTTPTGEVFYTTQKKVNEIYCRTNLTLSAGQLATIAAYKDSISNGIIPSEVDSNATGTIQLSPEVGSNSNSQVAALANSFFGKIWSFIKWIFGYK